MYKYATRLQINTKSLSAPLLKQLTKFKGRFQVTTTVNGKMETKEGDVTFDANGYSSHQGEVFSRYSSWEGGAKNELTGRWWIYLDGCLLWEHWVSKMFTESQKSVNDWNKANIQKATTTCTRPVEGEANKSEATISRKCTCDGSESTQLQGFDHINSFLGEGYLDPKYFIDNELIGLSKLEWSNKVRRWVKEASQYHGVPQMMLATIIEQENGQNATEFQKFGQSVERIIQMTAGTAEQTGYKDYPDQISGGSTGIVNMTRGTLQKAVKYIQDNYCRPLMPNSVRYQTLNLLLGQNVIDRDVGHAGTSIHVDLYYCAALLRMLIDDQTGKKCHKGALTKEQAQQVFRFYNGPAGHRYGQDAISKLERANQGGVLYYYAK
jgi:hypothetical protein